jgi:hypothetical protein
VRLPLGYALATDHLPPEVQGIRDRVEQLLLSTGDEDALLVLAHWQPPEAAWKKIRDTAAAAHQEPEAAVTALRSLHRRLERQRRGRLPAWEEEAAAVLSARLEKEAGPLTAAGVGAWAAAVAAAGVTAERLLAPLGAALLARAEPPGSLEAFDALLSAVESLGRGLRCPCAPSLYTEPVLAGLCASFPEESFPGRLKGRGALEEALARLKGVEDRLKSLFRDARLPGSLSAAALPPGSLPAARECCRQWAEGWRALLAAAPGLAALVSDTPLGRLHASVLPLEESLGRLPTVPPGCERVYVLDPKGLLDQPGLLFEFSATDLVVISTTVEADLEQLRADGHQRQAAGSAARTLQQVRATNVRRDEPDLSLVLPDGLPSLDRATVALALKYRAVDPVVLTPDAALINKARAAGLKASDLSEFRPARHRAAVPQPSRPAQGKKGRKRR